MYGPAVDNNFATNKWVYRYYSPQTVTDVKLSDGSVVTQTTPNTAVPNTAASKTAWDPYVGYFQLSRFKFVEDAAGARIDMRTEQQILRVTNNRQECCHVTGDIDFDSSNNLWLVTGDDTPAAGLNGGGYGPFNDQLTDEQQVPRLTGATRGTYTLTWEGQTTAPIAFNATANDVQTSGGPANTANLNVFFRRAKAQKNQTQITINGAGLTGTTAPTVDNTTAQEGGWYQRPTGDDRRSTLNTNDLRGKIVKVKVKDNTTAADANKADYTGTGTGAYTIPAGNLFPELYTGGVAPHGADIYEYSASNANTKKFPAYYDKSIFMGEFGQDTMREIKRDSQNRVSKIDNTLDCGAANVATSNFPFECDNPEDLQFGDDGALHLLTYGDGFFAINPDAGMYKWEYVKGQRAPKAVINRHHRGQHQPDGHGDRPGRRRLLLVRRQAAVQGHRLGPRGQELQL